MATIGTSLGGIWANESWGRYWGWVVIVSLMLLLIFSGIKERRITKKPYDLEIQVAISSHPPSNQYC